MLFHFGKLWKNLFFLIGVWVFYLSLGFELTVITLLALLYGINFNTR